MVDEDIINLFFARSEQAITELDGKYGSLCRRISYNILRNHEDVEECMNDTYLGIWNAIPPEKPNPLGSYLCKIIRNLSLKRYYRNTAKKRNSTHDAALEELQDCLSAPGSPEEILEIKELTGSIERFLDTLSAENRVIFLRWYWFCDPYDRIAEQTGLSEKTVSVRLVRIRRKMQRYLAEQGVL